MSNRIHSFLPPSIEPYRRAPAPREAAPPQKTVSERPTASVRDAAPTVPGPPLTAEEQQMIAREFPNRPKLALRLYGPGAGSRTLTPQGLGSRLDLRA